MLYQSEPALYQSEPALIAVDYSYSTSNEWVVKELAVVDCQANRVSLFIIEILYSWAEVTPTRAETNSQPECRNNWNDEYAQQSKLEILQKEATSLPTAIHCFGAGKTTFLKVQYSFLHL
jgi:hypothetical protein